MTLPPPFAGATGEDVVVARSSSEAPRAMGRAADPNCSERERANLEVARRYLSAIEEDNGSQAGSAAESFFAPDVVQEEFPNRFSPNGARRDLSALREAAARGRAVIRRQRFEIRRAHADGDTVILEVGWYGALSVPVGALQPGDEMRAHFAVVLDFRDGLIVRQRNYDCFEPF